MTWAVVLLGFLAYIALWTAFKGDGQGGYNPMTLVAGVFK